MNLLFLLCMFLLCSCGDARYRLDGHIPPTSTQVALLDGAATRKVNRLRSLFESTRDSLRQVAEGEIADVRSRLSESEDALRSAKRRLNDASSSYRTAFEKIKRFESFGGNLIFTDEDRSVSTKELLAEIADRFYKGKVFSLETGAEIRSFIRESLIPAEQRVIRARRGLRKVEEGSKADEAAIIVRKGDLKEDQEKLLENYNQRILDTLTGAVLAVAPADSSGYYRFDLLSPARYHLYLESPSHTLTTVELQGHGRRNLDPAASLSPLLGASDIQSL